MKLTSMKFTRLRSHWLCLAVLLLLWPSSAWAGNGNGNNGNGNGNGGPRPTPELDASLLSGLASAGYLGFHLLKARHTKGK